MKKLFIFFGHHKVGSSSLQSHFAENYQALRKQRVLYPLVEPLGANTALYAPNAALRPLTKTNIKFRQPHNALAFQLLSEQPKGGKTPKIYGDLPNSEKMFALIKAQEQKFEPETLVLVSEVMSNFANPSAGDALKTLLKHFPDYDIHAIAYLRRPDQYLESWYGQRLKFGHKLPPIHNGWLKEMRAKIHFDYPLMIKPWIEVLDRERVHLVDYNDVMKQGGSIKAFNRILIANGVDISTIKSNKKFQNPSFHPAFYKQIRMSIYNGTFSGKFKNDPNLLKDSTLTFLPKAHKTELFGKKVRNRIYNQFEPHKKWLDENFPSSNLFEDYDDILKLKGKFIKNENPEIIKYFNNLVLNKTKGR